MTSQKPKRAVLVSLSKQGEEFIISLDDARQHNDKPVMWEQAEHFTSKPVLEKSIDELDWSEKELADFGYYILARLYAFKSLNEI